MPWMCAFGCVQLVYPVMALYVGSMWLLSILMLLYGFQQTCNVYGCAGEEMVVVPHAVDDTQFAVRSHPSHLVKLKLNSPSQMTG